MHIKSILKYLLKSLATNKQVFFFIYEIKLIKKLKKQKPNVIDITNAHLNCFMP